MGLLKKTPLVKQHDVAILVISTKRSSKKGSKKR
jgi:hypothetical protein